MASPASRSSVDSIVVDVAESSRQILGIFSPPRPAQPFLFDPEAILVEDEFRRQLAIPSDGTDKQMLALFKALMLVLSKTSIRRDPYLRSSIFVLWGLMQDERLSGMHSSDLTIAFTPEQGYYHGIETDLMSLESLELNPTAPRMPAPARVPREVHVLPGADPDYYIRGNNQPPPAPRTPSSRAGNLIRRLAVSVGIVAEEPQDTF